MIRPTYSQTEHNIAVGAERFRCPDMLSQPSFIGEEASGFRDTSFHYIMKCAVDSRKVVRECRVVAWHKPFPRDCGARDEGTDRVVSSTMNFKVFASPRVVRQCRVVMQHEHVPRDG